MKRFIGRVANPEDMLILQRNKKRPERGRGGGPLLAFQESPRASFSRVKKHVHEKMFRK